MPQKRILIIEDSEIDILILTHTLSAEYHLKIANSAEAATLALAANSFDIILLDILLPGLGGLDFCRQLKQVSAYAAIPIIFVSGQQKV